MNLSPEWVPAFNDLGWQAIHWSSIGNPRDADTLIMAWARAHGHIVFTHDLDFGAILAASRDSAPSVVQIRTQNITPEIWSPTLQEILRKYSTELETGCLLTIDETRARIRILPI